MNGEWRAENPGAFNAMNQKEFSMKQGAGLAESEDSNINGEPNMETRTEGRESTQVYEEPRAFKEGCENHGHLIEFLNELASNEKTEDSFVHGRGYIRKTQSLETDGGTWRFQPIKEAR